MNECWYEVGAQSNSRRLYITLRSTFSVVKTIHRYHFYCGSFDIEYNKNE